METEGQLTVGEGHQRGDLGAVHLRQADTQDKHERQQEEDGQPCVGRADHRVSAAELDALGKAEHRMRSVG